MRSSFRDPWTSHGWQRIKLPPHLCEQPPINHNVHSICHSTNDSSKHCWLCPSYRHTESLWAGPQKYKKETFNNQSKRGLAKREWRDLQKASSHTFRLKTPVPSCTWESATYILLGFQEFETSLVAQRVKASAYNAGDPGSIPGLGRSPGEGNGNPLQYSCLENPMDGEAW